MVHEAVVGDVSLEIGAGEDGDHPTHAIEVGCDGVFVAQLSFRKVDAAKCGRAGGWRDGEDDVVG